MDSNKAVSDAEIDLLARMTIWLRGQDRLRIYGVALGPLSRFQTEALPPPLAAKYGSTGERGQSRMADFMEAFEYENITTFPTRF